MIVFCRAVDQIVAVGRFEIGVADTKLFGDLGGRYNGAVSVFNFIDDTLLASLDKNRIPLIAVAQDKVIRDCTGIFAVDLNCAYTRTEFKCDVAIGVFAEYVFTVTYIKQERVLAATADKQVVAFLAADGVIGVFAAFDVAVVVVARQNMVLECRQSAIGNAGAIGEA